MSAEISFFIQTQYQRHSIMFQRNSLVHFAQSAFLKSITHPTLLFNKGKTMKFKKNDKISSFQVDAIYSLEEIAATLILFTHLPSGASVVKIANEDEENVFSLCFPTWPSNATGVAHILEHTVLCGSKKYPIRDPFFSMTRRSLNTYMNALTGSDFTCYPAASLIPKDFYNLLEVYLDACFFPTLSELSFAQEGWRLSFDANNQLTFEGIVFNEMKGAMATKESRLYEALHQALFPDVTYGVNSGGDPKEIVHLTHEELRKFHQDFYSPSRCTFYFYGNLPIEEQLLFLEKHVLHQAEKKEPLFLAQQKRFSEKKEIVSYFPGKDEDKSMISFGYLTCSILEQKELLALSVLDLLLMGTDASPLKKALLTSQLCQQFDSILDQEIAQVPYLFIAKGCEKESKQALEELMKKTLTHLMQEGFSQEMIEGAIHQLELSRLEITGGSTPYGLSLFFRSIPLKQHGGSPESGLLIHSLFEQLRNEPATIYTDLIQKYLLGNSHQVILQMHSDPHLLEKEKEDELKELRKREEVLTPEDKEAIVKENKKLKAYQQKKDQIELLPKVDLFDVPPKSKHLHLEQSQDAALAIYSHECFTNHLTYVDLLFDLPPLELEEFMELRMFSYLLPQLGAGGWSYEQTLDYMMQETGGISCFFDLSATVDGKDALCPFICIRGKALDRKKEHLFELIKKMLHSLDFKDTKRIQELFTQLKESISSSIERSALRYAISLASSNFSLGSTIANQCFGLPFYWKICEWEQQIEKNPTFFIEKMQKMHEKVLGLKKSHLVISAGKETLQELKNCHYYGLPKHCKKESPPFSMHFSPILFPSQARIINSDVAFSTLFLPTIGYLHPDSPYLSLAAEIMENQILHPEIREKQGAYGSGAVCSALQEQFYFYSLRDPKIKASWKVFIKSIDQVIHAPLEEEIEQAKLQIFQDLDNPIPPYSRGFTAFLRLRTKRTLELRQAFRDKIFQADKHSIQKAVENHLQKHLDSAIFVTFASKQLLTKELKNELPIYSPTQKK